MSTVIASPDSDTEVPVYPALTLADRSCAMGSGSTQALVRVVKGTQDLLFDGHSFNEYQAKLIAEGWSVYEDIRVTAENKPMAAY